MREVSLRIMCISLTLFVALAAGGCQSQSADHPPASLSAENDALERERQRVMRELAALETELAAREATTQPPLPGTTPGAAAREGRPAPATAIRKVWFYDLNTGELFAAPVDAVPPIDAPSGPMRGGSGGKAGVRAYVFTCDDCGDASSRFIAYLETYTPEAAKRLAEARRTARETRASVDFLLLASEMRQGRLVRRVDDQQWVSASSEDGAKIVTSVARRCAEGARPRPCFPTE